MSSVSFMNANERWSIRLKNEYGNTENTVRQKEIPEPAGQPMLKALAEAALHNNKI